MDGGKLEGTNEEVTLKQRMKGNKILHWPDRNEA